MIQKLRKNKKSILRTGLITGLILVVVLALVSSGFLLPSKQVQASPNPDWLSGWAKRIKITIDQTDIDANLTDFPVLVKLTSSNFDFSKARSDGFDVRFCSSDGTTLLAFERERHDSTNSLAEYWVKIPSISSSTDTDFYIYYGKSDAADGADPTAVWDANFTVCFNWFISCFLCAVISICCAISDSGSCNILLMPNSLKIGIPNSSRVSSISSTRVPIINIEICINCS